MPAAADIDKAYENYFTHHETDPTVGRTPGLPWHRRYMNAADGLAGRFVQLLTERSAAAHREHVRRMQLYLDEVEPGLVLEVGCGDGRYLSILRTLGWDVEGQEVDHEAAESARRVEGLIVHEGLLEELGLGAGSYDAILMSHVIEHVHDPQRLLVECHRLLKQTGQIVIITPNVASYGHLRFRRDWRALDPPRHLHLFSLGTLTTVVQRAGFIDIEAWTSAEISQFIALESLQTRNRVRGEFGTYPSFRERLLARAFVVAMNLAWLKDRYRGEECVVRARRPRSALGGGDA